MYQNPISIHITNASESIGEQIDRAIMSQVKMQVDINIDEEELRKALKYDREQYWQGYIDGEKACMTAEKAVGYLQDCGWLRAHDKILTRPDDTKKKRREDYVDSWQSVCEIVSCDICPFNDIDTDGSSLSYGSAYCRLEKWIEGIPE